MKKEETKLLLNEEEFKKLENPSYDLEKDKKLFRENLFICYNNIMDTLKKYCDLKEEYYNLLTIWIIGTYFHEQFISYPYLFFNAMKGSGKTRTLNLVTSLSKNGEVLNSLTEAVLFRTKGTLGIDEFEGIERKGMENLKELLNSAYKRGTKVKRMKQKKTNEGVEQVVEEFDVFRPIVMANIWGMDNVLGDRCVTLILEKSNKQKITNLLEIFREEIIVKETIKLLNWCSLCRCSFSVEDYMMWNYFITNNYTNNTNTINNINNTNNILLLQTFKTINLSGLVGRELELSFPLILISSLISEDVLKETTLTLSTTFKEKRIEDFVENKDISLIDFVSQKCENYYLSVNEITREFREFLQTSEEWINSKWLGRALKRLNLIKEKRRVGRGTEVILNIEKAQERIKVFK